MIKNERQYRITKSQIANFERALSEFAETPQDDPTHELMKFKLQKDALRSQLNDLQTEIREYDALRLSNPGVLELAGLDELPRALIQARIASGISQAALAKRLGLKEQQIQRYESTNYDGVSLDRIQEILRALDVRTQNDVFLPTNPVSVGTLFKRLKSAGLSRDFVERRLIPKRLRTLSEETDTHRKDSGDIATSIAEIVGKVFNWPVPTLFSTLPLPVHTGLLAPVRYKVPANAAESRVSIYTVYAHYLALIALQATPSVHPKSLISDSTSLRAALAKRFRDLSLRSVLSFMWDCGIVVLPLADAGAFHGACWRIDGRNIIVVKQRTASDARWIIDILHEYFHATQEPDTRQFSRIESSDSLSPASAVNQDDEAELAATDFAIDVALESRAEDLVAECVKRAHSRVEGFKRVVPLVARDASVDVGILANYVAYRLSLEGVNWWPVAAGLQRSGDNPFDHVRRIFLEKADLSVLNPTDRDLLLMALSEEL